MRIEKAAEEYLDHAGTYYAGSREFLNCRRTLELVCEHAANLDENGNRLAIRRVNDLTAAALQRMQDGMVAADFSLGYINQTIMRTRRIWKWFEVREIVHRGTAEHLKCVPSLRNGRSQARETSPVGPVPADTVWATVEQLGQPHADIVALMILTGARVSEICCMRTGDIDTTDEPGAKNAKDANDTVEIWWYSPAKHKTSWRGADRIIPIDARAQGVLINRMMPFHPDAYLFPASKGSRHLSPSAVYHAIRRTCERMGVESWHPHQVRHEVACAADRAGASMEEIQALLGHSDPKSTRRYVKPRNKRGRHAIRAISRKDSTDG